MSPDELMAALAPSRLPQTMQGPGWPELLVLFSLGLMAGLLLAFALSPFLGKRVSRKHLIRGTRNLPPQERLLAIARILGRLPEALRPAAYGAEPSPPADVVERIAGRGR